MIVLGRAASPYQGHSICGHIFGGQKIARIFPRKQSKPLGIANFPVLVEIGLDRNSSAFGNLKLPRSITHGDVF